MEELSRDRRTSRGAKILVVDDRLSNRVAFRAILEPLCRQIVEVDSGVAAIKAATENDFAAILLDVVMPDMDGLETMARLRQQGVASSTPIILITAGDTDLQEIARAYALGATDYIVKPVQTAILRGKVTACLSLYFANEELRAREAALSMKDRQIAMLAHDLRNPLNTIVAAGALLTSQGTTDPAKQRTFAERISRAAARMDSMIHDLLDYARTGTGTFPIVRKPMDMGTLCRELVQEFEVADPERRIELVVSGEIIGEWDGGRIYQALSNLLGNATHYGHGRARVRIARDGDQVQIEVHNDGPPISAELLPTIFDAFRRGSDASTGLGLGLYIVRSIAQAHGGDVSVESNSAQGTTFVLSLPVVATSARMIERGPNTADREDRL